MLPLRAPDHGGDEADEACLPTGEHRPSIAQLLGVSRNTIYSYVPELKGGRLALAESTNKAELHRPSRPEN